MSAIGSTLLTSVDQFGLVHKQPGGIAKNYFMNAADPGGFFLNTSGGMKDQQNQTAAAGNAALADATARYTAAASASDGTKTLLGG